MSAALKDFRRPWLWLGVWLLLVAYVVQASLGPPTAGPDVPASDKWMHLLAYAGLAAGAVQVFRPERPLQAVAVGLVALGIALEVAQGTLTSDRTMDWRDAVANATGVGLGLLTALGRGRDALLTVEARGRG